MVSLSKNTIIGIAAGSGAFAGLISGVMRNWTLMAFFTILTIFVCGMIYMVYDVPDGEACTPNKADSNVATWVMDKGLCTATSCVNDGQYVVIDTKHPFGRCVTPTALPSGWSNAVSSNTFTSNLIGSSFKTDTEWACGYSCRDEPKCVIAAYDSGSNMCSLYSHDDSASATGPKADLIVRPKKTS